MVYETAIVAQADLDEEKLSAIKAIVEDVVKNEEGEILVNDDWGVRTFAQPTSNGKNRGHYLYYMYEGCGKINNELERRFGINEYIIKNSIIKLGSVSKKESFVKEYRSPFAR